GPSLGIHRNAFTSFGARWVDHRLPLQSDRGLVRALSALLCRQNSELQLTCALSRQGWSASSMGPCKKNPVSTPLQANIAGILRPVSVFFMPRGAGKEARCASTSFAIRG